MRPLGLRQMIAVIVWHWRLRQCEARRRKREEGAE